MKLKQTEGTVVTLANGAELVRYITQGVTGNEVADTFNGSPLTREVLHTLAQSEFQNAVSKSLGE